MWGSSIIGPRTRVQRRAVDDITPSGPGAVRGSPAGASRGAGGPMEGHPVDKYATMTSCLLPLPFCEASLFEQIKETRSQELADSAEGTLTSVESLASTLDSAVRGGQRDVTDMLQEFRDAAASIRQMSDQIQGLVAENREPLRDFTATGLYELANLLTEARQLITGLNRVTTEVERDPARFLFGDPQEGYEGK